MVKVFLEKGSSKCYYNIIGDYLLLDCFNYNSLFFLVDF